MRHYEEPVVAYCRTCTRPYCSRCLVYSFGPDKPPFCVGCALNASGVRNKNKPIPVAAQTAPGPDRRAERAQRKAEKAEAKAHARAMKRAAKQGQVAEAVEAPRTSNVPVPKGLPTPSARFAPQPERAVS
ncbi:MAG: B-box zinc finger protein [Aquihabitans sp.]